MSEQTLAPGSLLERGLPAAAGGQGGWEMPLGSTGHSAVETWHGTLCGAATGAPAWLLKLLPGGAYWPRVSRVLFMTVAVLFSLLVIGVWLLAIAATLFPPH